jgi:hypothetical protein
MPESKGSAAMFDVVANIKLSDLLRERTHGELVNAHIMQAQKEPQPDFEAMRQAIHGGVKSDKIAERRGTTPIE